MTPLFEKKGTRLRVTAPLYSTVSLRKGWRWKKLHDGRTWSRYGLLAATPDFSVELPITDTVRVEASGATYVHRAEKPLPRVFHIKEWKRGGRYFLISIFLHVAVGLVLVKLAATAITKTVTLEEVAGQPEQATPEAEAAQGESAPVIAKPFQGMTYSAFLKQMIETSGTAAERLKSMMGGAGISLGGGGAVAKSDKPIASGSVIASALGRNIRARAPVASGTTVAMKGNNIEEKDRVALKKSLADLQEDMRRAYSSALMIDPSLAVTAVLEMTVQPSGSLVLSGFQVKGKYTEAGLAKLRAGVAELVRGVKARAALSGTVVRAESAFIH